MSKINSCADRKFYFAYWSLRSPCNKTANNLFSLCSIETRFWVSVVQHGDFAIPASGLPVFAFFLFFFFYAHAILSSCPRRMCSSFYNPYSNLLITKPKSRPAIGLLCCVKVAVDSIHICCLKWHFFVWQLFNSCLLKQYWGPQCTTETLEISQVLNTYNMVV